MKIPFRGKRFRKQYGFKCWRLILDEHGHPTSYQQDIRELIPSSSISTASELENISVTAGVKHGTSRRQRLLLLIHPQKLKRWKTNHLNVFLGIPNWWKDLSVIICPGLPDDAV